MLAPRLSAWLYPLAELARVAWVGAMWAVGYLAVPVLFASLDDRMLAGAIAGRMFEILAWLGMACGMLLLVVERRRRMQRVLVTGMLVCVTLGHFGLQPAMADLKRLASPQVVSDSPHARAFKTLHGISSVLFLIQSVAGVALVLSNHRRGRERLAMGPESRS